MQLTQLAIICVFLFSIAGYLGRSSKYCELASHFKTQYLLAALCCLLIFVALRAWPWALGAAVSLFINASVVLPWYISQRTTASQLESGRKLRVLQANVLYENRRFAAFTRLVNEENPDVVIAQEITDEWVEKMRVLSEPYPYNKIVPRNRGGGIALFSRFPLTRCEVVSLGHDERPGITAHLLVGGTSVSLFTFHTHAPLRRDHFGWRNQQLAAAARLIRTLPQPAIAIGDFNTTMWSPYFKQLVERTGLINARQGFGLLPTWPLWLQLPVLMLPIDHCLVTSDIGVDNIRTGRRAGSDHLPLIVDLAIPFMDQVA